MILLEFSRIIDFYNQNFLFKWIKRKIKRNILNLKSSNILYLLKLKYIDYTSFNENSCNFKTKNFTIAYESNKILRFGLIISFFKIDQTYYCLVQKLQKSKNFTDDILIEQELSNLYCICSLLNEFELIKFENIIDKCILIINNNDYFVRICNRTEHD